MIKKLTKIVTNNFGLKILAVFFAVILWLVVVNVDDPTKPKKITASVTLENVTYMDTLGKCYEIMDDSTTVTFTISAKRSILDSINASDFTLKANMEKIEYNEKADCYQIPITITPIRYTSQITVTSQTQYVTVALEDLMKKKVMITAGTEGKVAEGCALGDVVIDTTNVINISGPESIVSQISTAVATINVEGMSTDITDNVIPVLYDQNGEIVDTTKLKLSVDTVAVSASILNTKEVDIHFQTTGTPKAGYEVTEVVCNPEKVSIKGAASVLNTIDSIEIPEEVLDISGISQDLTKDVDITTYLPNGVSLVEKEQSKVNVVVHVEQWVTRDFDVPVENLTLTNVSTSYRAKYEVDTVKVTISALASDMEGISASQIKGTVDASGLSAGTHMVQVNWEIDTEIYTVSSNATAAVSLEEKKTESSQTSTETTDNNANKNDGAANQQDNNSSGNSEDNVDSSEEKEESATGSANR